LLVPLAQGGGGSPVLDVRRREFITLLGGVAVAWPLAAWAQQPTTPLIGHLHSGSPNAWAPFVAAFRNGLKEAGYVEGQNIAIEFRWAEDQVDRLPALAADLVRCPVAVIVCNTLAALAAKAATTTIPIVFGSGTDPVKLGLVASFSRPGGNVTGVSFYSNDLEAKRLGLLHELVPQATVIAAFVNPNFPDVTDRLRDLQEAARTLGKQIQILNVSTATEIDMKGGKLRGPFF
jgi:putative tryptophan/tyrosine transport system substrate-binding protein